VLERRDEAWRTLHDYVLNETETFSIDGPGQLPLNGYRREFTWYVREGYLVRSPVRYDGVTLSETDRRAYEARWLKEEKAREERARQKPAPGRQRSVTVGQDVRIDLGGDSRAEPRFVSEAYFLQFKFEPGNYYLAGRERLNGRDVVKIEYYPTALFGEEGEARKPPPASSAKAATKRAGRAEEPDEDDIERKMNKVALVTLWVDPSEFQIVRYTFDNIEFDFLPGRWLVRLDKVTASMTMTRVFEGVWLPAEIRMHAGLAFASGAYGIDYTRRFYDYKKAEVGARVRVLPPKAP